MKKITHEIRIADRSENMNRFFADIRHNDVLSKEETARLAEEMKAGGRRGEKVREKLILSNQLFVVKVAKQYMGMGLPLESLISEGNLGLVAAVDRYDPSRGVTLLSFAVKYIQSTIINALQKYNHLESKLKENDVFLVSGDDILFDDGEESRFDLMESDEAPADQAAVAHSDRQLLNAYLSKLMPFYRNILSEFYGLNSVLPTSTKELAYKYDCSESIIHNIIQNSLRNLSQLATAA